MARAIVKSHSSSSIGSVKQSMLDEATFQSIHGTGWVLMDGRDLSVTNPGSAYETLTGQSTLPDARGQFLRGKNNSRNDGNEDPDGERAIGSYQADEFATHTHQHVRYGQTTSTGGFAIPPQGANPTPQFGTTTEAGGNETRPKNITVNIFIKINE